MVICVVVVLVALFIVTTAIVAPFLAAYGEDAPETLTANAIANLVWNATMIAAVVWFVRRGGGSARDLGLSLPKGKSGSWPRVLGLASATFVAMYIVVVIYGLAIDAFGLDFLEPDQQVPDEFYDSDVALAVLGVAIVIGAPITEEIFFRGFLFGGTRPLTGAMLAAVITGFIFSLAHYNPGLILPFTAIGAMLALSYQRSGTLFVPIGAHFLFNLVSFSVLVFVPEARPESEETVQAIMRLLGV
jgi:membrane protease YdiL (CAAX protease family)